MSNPAEELGGLEFVKSAVAPDLDKNIFRSLMGTKA